MLNSDAWAGCQAYAENYPAVYETHLNDVTGGDPPKTIQECKEIVKRCQAEIQANAGSVKKNLPFTPADSDAGDDIPY